jgi:hypothetical protein
MSNRKGLTPAEHVEVGALLKEARNNLLIAAKMTRCYGRLSDQLVAIADSFMSQGIGTAAEAASGRGQRGTADLAVARASVPRHSRTNTRNVRRKRWPSVATIPWACTVSQTIADREKTCERG